MGPRGLLSGTPFSVAASGSTSAVATKAAITSQRNYIVDVSGSSDTAGATIIIADAGTTIWEDIIGAGYYQHTFGMPIGNSAVNSALTVTVTGTTHCYANMSGYSL